VLLPYTYLTMFWQLLRNYRFTSVTKVTFVKVFPAESEVYDNIMMLTLCRLFQSDGT